MSLEGKSTRRGFLKQAGLVTGGAALTGGLLGSLGAGAADAATPTWTQTADIVIVGGGGVRAGRRHRGTQRHVQAFGPHPGEGRADGRNHR